MTDVPRAAFESFFSHPDLDAMVERMIEEFVAGDGVSSPADPAALAAAFAATTIPDEPIDVRSYLERIASEVVANSVRTMSPQCMAHMTSGLPYFMRPLGTLMLALNQNLMKADASRAVMLLERQAIAMLHRIVYRRTDAFYAEHVQAAESTLGIAVSGGTLGNITALWCARNAAFPAGDGLPGVEEDGLTAALHARGLSGAVVIGSRLAHYSVAKSAGMLGLGERGFIQVEVDAAHRVDARAVARSVRECRSRGQHVIAIVGVAGTTEVGSIDPLCELAEIAGEAGIHLHVDAAWGGPLLYSDHHAAKLAGIERADSVTFDGHKRLFAPIGIAVVLLRDPLLAKAIEKRTTYVLRAGAPDLGKRTIDGSRPATALFVHAALSIFGRRGLAALVDHSHMVTARFRDEVRARSDFELLAEPELHIVLYRYVRPGLDARSLDELNRRLHDAQAAEGRALVGLTTVALTSGAEPVVALRAVIANPLADNEDVITVLDDQRRIAAKL